MGAPNGNKFWLARSSHGRKLLFENPEALWDAACEYFQWVDDNPLEEEKLFHANGIITKDKVYHPRPMTLSGLRLFLGISEQTWLDYRKRDGFIGVCQEIDATIYNQKFAGATAGLMNANIIVRDLGLRDGQDVKQTTTATVTHSVDPVSKLADILKDYDSNSE